MERWRKRRRDEQRDRQMNVWRDGLTDGAEEWIEGMDWKGVLDQLIGKAV
jgi:hypothetical protein